MNNTILGIFLAFVCFTSALIGGVVVMHKVTAQQHTGSVDINVLPPTPTATSVWVGTSDTLVVASSSGRVRLEVGNISGATSTAQALYCNVGDRPSVLYQGIVVQASSSKAFTLDDMTRGAVRCRFPVSASTVTVIDF
jgi:hypothetical protein